MDESPITALDSPRDALNGRFHDGMAAVGQPARFPLALELERGRTSRI